MFFLTVKAVLIVSGLNPGMAFFGYRLQFLERDVLMHYLKQSSNVQFIRYVIHWLVQSSVF